MDNTPNNADIGDTVRVRERHELPQDVPHLSKIDLSQGRSFHQAARDTGVDAGYLCALENGRRAPSIVVAEALIEGYKITSVDAEQ